MDSSKKKVVVLIGCIAVFILGVFGSNVLYDYLSDNVKNKASENLIHDISEAKGQADTNNQYVKNPTGNSVNVADSSDNTSSDITLNKAPDFTVYTMDGTPVTLHEKTGKPIIINFWATWCGPCKKEMPHFQKAYLEFKDEIEFMMINPTDGINDTMQSVEKFISDTGYTFPVYCDTDTDAAYVYGINSFPVTFFIDSDGYALGYFPGMMDEATLYACIEIVLGKR